MLYIYDIDNNSFGTSDTSGKITSVYPKLYYATSVLGTDDENNPLVTIRHRDDGSYLLSSYSIGNILIDDAPYVDKESFVAAFNALMNAGEEANEGTLESILDELEEINADQSSGSQKTQIVDGAGDIAGVTGGSLDINIKGITLPDPVIGTIDLSSDLVIPAATGRRLSYGQATIQMITDDISETTAFYLEFSCDGVNWDNATENGTDVEDTLVVDVAKVIPFESPVGLYWRIRFASGSTGNVDYVIIG